MFWQRLQGRASAIVATGVSVAAVGYLLYNAVRYQPTQSKVKSNRATEKHSGADQEKPPNSHKFQNPLKRKAVHDQEDAEPRLFKRACSEPIYLDKSSVTITPLSPIPTMKLQSSGSSSTLTSAFTEGKTSEASEKSDETDSTSEDAGLEHFREVIDSVDFLKLEAVALRVRQEVHKALQQSTGSKYLLPGDLSCEIDRAPKHGEFNLVYTIEFSDGLQWIARIPGHGAYFEGLDKPKMESEFETMRLIKNETKIPIPETYYYNCESSEIGSAFALMEFKRGVELQYPVWDTEMTEHQRLRVLNDIAEYMSQLQKLRYSKCGVLNFTRQQSEPTIGPQIYFLAYLTGKDAMPWGESYEVGPYNTYAEQLRGAWDPCKGYPKKLKSEMSIISLAIDSIPDYLDSKCPKALYMPDLNLHNMLVDENGTVVAFLDWDMVGTMPTSAGCAKFPPWIVEDWTNPLQFQYHSGALFHSTDEDDSKEKTRVAEEKASKYRSYYAACYARYAARQVDDYDPRTTATSHILEAIKSAIHNRESRTKLVSKLIEHAFCGEPPFTRDEYGEAFEADNTEEYDLMLKEAFSKMWDIEPDACHPEGSKDLSE